MEPAAPPQSGNKRRQRVNAALVVAVLAVLLIVWQWYDVQRRAKALQQQTQAMQVQIAIFEDRLHEMQTRQTALDALYQDLARSSDDSVLADIEQTLLIADQQLQISGNIQAALAAVQAADARLARNRSEFAPIRNALEYDIERLRRTPGVDVIGINARLAAVRGSVDTLPLAMDQHLQPSSPPERLPAAENTWQHFSREIWQELRSLVRIQNTDHAAAELLAPQQIFFVRENLKLRLLDARLALIAHDETEFKADLKAVHESLARYFAPNDPAVATALATAQQLADGHAGSAQPNVAASLAAVRDYRLAHESH
jgi:uroporphyrin-III C-methyltransferase